MSRWFHWSKAALGAATAALLSLGAAAPADAAIDKQISYQCKFPIIAPGVVDLDIQAPDVTEQWPTGEPTPAWGVTVKLKLAAPIPHALSAIDGLASLEAKAHLRADLVLTRPDGTFTVQSYVNLTIAKTPFTSTDDWADSLELVGTGTLPQHYQDDPARGQIVLRRFEMNLIARDASGRALPLAPITRDWDNKPWVDSDSNPETSDLVCRLNPAVPEQSLDLGVLDFGHVDDWPPQTPLDLRGVGGSGEARLDWRAAQSTVSEYRVYQQGIDEPVATVTGTSTTISGLNNGSTYAFAVTAVDDDGDESPRTDWVQVTPTDAVADNTPPTAPTVVAEPSQRSVVLRWDPSSDDVGVTGYEVFNGVTKVADLGAGATSYLVEGLAPATAYTFKVVAEDAAGNRSTPGTASATTDPDVPHDPGTRVAYQCKFPIIAPGKLTMDFRGSDIPSVWETGRPTPEWPLSAKTTLTAPIPSALSAIDGLASLEGQATVNADLVLTRSDGTFTVPSTAKLTMPMVPFVPTEDESATLALLATGTLPSHYQDESAQGEIVVRSIALNMKARDSSGKLLELAPVTRDWNNQPLVDSDHDPETFDVICRLDPSTPNQDLGIATLDFVDVEEPGGPPTIPTGLQATAGQNSAALTWNAATDPDGTVAKYVVYVNGVKVKEVVGSTSTTITGLVAGTSYLVQVAAVDDDGWEGMKSAGVSVTPVVASNQAPSTPPAAEPQPGDLTPTTLVVRWGAGTDPDGAITGYRIQLEDEVKTVGADARSVTFTGLGPDYEYEALVWAIDDGNLLSRVPLVVRLATPHAESVKPSVPGKPTLVGSPGPTELHLTWAPSTDVDGIKEYRVYKNDAATPVVATTTNSARITGLTPDTAYSFKVVAVDSKNLHGDASPTATFRTAMYSQPGSVRRSYALTGTTAIKTLSRGTLPIKGGIDADLTVSTGAIEADLTLNPTSGRLTALGFLPVTAKIGFAPSGKTVGTLLDGQLNTTSKVRIKVQEVKLFGAIPLAGGNNCQTKALSEIKLKNTQEFFDYTVGGPIAGSYAISDLNGCGVLNGLVSPLTAGAGNTLTLNLTPVPAQAN